MIRPADRFNFAVLGQAIKTGEVALVEVERVADGAVLTAICTIRRSRGKHLLTPVATMVEGDPFEQFNPPNPAGGFYRKEEAR